MTGSCPICGGLEHRTRYVVRNYPILECAGCRGYYLGAAPGGVPVEPDYQAGYLRRGEGSAGTLTGYFDYEAELPLHLQNFQENLQIVQRYARGRRLLDVGCASGHFLIAADRAGFEVMGIDVSRPAIEQVRRRWGYPALAGDIADIQLERRFDVITLWETLEHIADPGPVLERVKEWLAPEGVLVIGTGDNTSLLARALGRRWWYLNPPDHVVYYNPRALGILLERHGFRLEARHRILSHAVSSRNVAMKLLRSVQGGSAQGRGVGGLKPGSLQLPGLPVASERIRQIAAALPDVPLKVVHGTTMVVVAGKDPKTSGD